MGQLVLSAKETERLDISALSRGIYVLTLTDVAGTSYTKKVIRK
jgi:hypothetical protein